MLIPLRRKWKDTRFLFRIWSSHSANESAMGYRADGGLLPNSKLTCNSLFCYNRLFRFFFRVTSLASCKLWTSFFPLLNRLLSAFCSSTLVSFLSHLELYSAESVWRGVYRYSCKLSLTNFFGYLVGNQCFEDRRAASNAPIPSTMSEHAASYDWWWRRNIAGLCISLVAFYYSSLLVPVESFISPEICVK